MDSNWADNPDDKNSNAGYVFNLRFGHVTWPCRKQQTISLSSAEVEYQQWLMQVKNHCGFDISFS
jgi:hypothetical protein